MANYIHNIKWKGRYFDILPNGINIPGNAGQILTIDANGQWYAADAPASGVTAVAEGTANGTIAVTTANGTADVSVHGLANGAYATVETVVSNGANVPTGNAVQNYVADELTKKQINLTIANGAMAFTDDSQTQVINSVLTFPGEIIESGE